MEKILTDKLSNLPMGVFKKLNPQMTQEQAKYLNDYHNWLKQSDSPEVRAKYVC